MFARASVLFLKNLVADELFLVVFLLLNELEFANCPIFLSLW